MQHTVTLFEHESTPFSWTNRDVALLDRLRASIGDDVLRVGVQRGQYVIQAAQYVGVVRLGGRTIQVLPKSYRNEDSTSERQRIGAATRNLLHLLAIAGQLTIRESMLTGLLQRDSDWFEILTRLFATHLAEEWQRGAARNYQTVEEDLPLLKGRWRLADQLRRPERRHIFAVAYDDFTADNELNRVFRYVVERLWHLTRDTENRRLLGNVRQWMDEVTLLPYVHATAAPTTLVTRLNARFLPLLNLARMFLDGGALQLAAGEVANFAFVFDMNKLFEAFVANFMRRHRTAILPASLHDSDIVVQARGAATFLACTSGQRVFKLEPDLAVRCKARYPVLIDTKYKHLHSDKRSLGVAEADMYQMHAYAMRYDCPRVVLLYPQTAGISALATREFAIEHDPSKRVVVATVDIRGDIASVSVRTSMIEQLRTMLEGSPL